MRTFKLARVTMGSGWPSAHVAIDSYLRFPDKPGGDEMCLTLDAQNFDEFSAEIDGLIAELEAIRTEAPARIDQWVAEWRLSRAPKAQDRKIIDNDE